MSTRKCNSCIAPGSHPAAVLQSATVNAARVLHREHEIGQVSPGFYADVVILDKNPLKNITNTRAIHAVVKRGQLYKPKDLLTMNGEIER